MAVDPTVHEMRNAVLRTTRPVLTAKEIAEESGVTKQTVLNRKEELVADGRVEMDTIGQATVFWARAPEWDLGEPTLDDSRGRAQEKWRDAEVGRRATWLDAKSRLSDIYRTGDDLEARMRLWRKLHSYIGCSAYRPTPFTADEVAELEDAEDDHSRTYEWDKRVTIPPSSRLTEDEVREFDAEVRLFGSEWFGAVEGISGLERFRVSLRDKLDVHLSDDGREWEMDNVPREELDELYPSFGDIVVAGDTYDRLFCGIYGVEW